MRIIARKSRLDRLLDALVEEGIAWLREYGKEAREGRTLTPKTKSFVRIIDADFEDLPPKRALPRRRRKTGQAIQPAPGDEKG